MTAKQLARKWSPDVPYIQKCDEQPSTARSYPWG